MTTDNQRTFLPPFPPSICMLPRLYRYTHTRVRRHTESIYLNGPSHFFLSSISFYFILFPLGSQLSCTVAVSSRFYLSYFFSPSLLLQTNHFEGDYPVREKAGAKKEYRMKNSVTSLPLLHSVYFVPGPFFFLFLFLLYVFPSAFLSLSFLLLCKSVFIYISGSFPAAHTDTHYYYYSSQWLVIISKAPPITSFSWLVPLLDSNEMDHKNNRVTSIRQRRGRARLRRFPPPTHDFL